MVIRILPFNELARNDANRNGNPHAVHDTTWGLLPSELSSAYQMYPS